MRRRALLALVALAGVAACKGEAPRRERETFPERVERVIDGDTLVMVGGEVVRVLGVDTPEIRGACEAERRMAQSARMMTEAWVKDGVRLERHGRDRYGRTLAVVRTPHGHDLAHWLIEFGMGAPFHGRKPREGWCP